MIWICLEEDQKTKLQKSEQCFNPSGDLDLSGRIYKKTQLEPSFVSILLVIWICLEDVIVGEYILCQIRVSILLVIWICLEVRRELVSYPKHIEFQSFW